MASSLIGNTNQVHFASVLAMDNTEMVAMFEALVASGLNGFLGFMSDIFETALIEFYQNASVRDGKVVSTVKVKLVEISEEIFSRTFQLPVEGLIDINEVPKDLIFYARTEFSFTGEQLTTSCKKREWKIEYRLLSDIVAKSITVKAGSFDVVTHERFLMMTAIFGGVPVNWGRLLFKIFKDMVTSETRQARGYAVHICILLKNIPNLELGDSEEFSPLKILTAKTVGRYIAINDKIAFENVEGLAGKSRKISVKETPVKRPVSKKRPTVAVDEQVMKKKRTLKRKAAPSKAKLKLVSVALDVEPIQTIDPTSADDVDIIIIEQVIADTGPLDTDVGSPTAQRNESVAAKATGTDTVMGAADIVVTEALCLAKDFATMMESEDTGSVIKPLELNISTTSDEESILSKLGDLELVKGIISKEKQLLAWAETDSLETAVRRREFTIAKYREMLLRKFLESHRQHFQAGQPSTATDHQIIALLSNAHVFVVETLQTKMRIHGLKWDHICSSRLFEGENRDRGADFARSNISTRSLCWLQTKTLAEGTWVIQEGNDLWQCLPKQTVPLTIELSPKRKFDYTLAPMSEFVKVLHKQDIVAVSTVIDSAVDASNFVGVFRRGTDVHMILSESSSSSSGSAHPDPTVFASFSQRPLDTDLTSPNPSTTSSHVFFTTDDTPMGVDQILMPTAKDSDRLQDMLLMEVRSLEKKIIEMLIQHDSIYRGLFNNMRQEIQIQKSALSLDILASQRKLITQQAAIATGLDDIRKDVDETKAALSNSILDFHAQAQENYNNLSSQLGELVAYINRVQISGTVYSEVSYSGRSIVGNIGHSNVE
ncbi:hypothetical protein F511_37123 [Dorcoceras hygrometricum]|uniref:Dystroglycan-like n=1 Tax=Dorcoceras hygrometricum TaxID=472368 RepID=A0A2Z7A519_9LAMI|nr:hypothetical protein F511_37123 [Dorcoceras hygrometricum]